MKEMKANRNQTDRLSKQHKESEGPKGIFGESAQRHDLAVDQVSRLTLEALKKEFPKMEFRHRMQIEKSEINKKLGVRFDRKLTTRSLYLMLQSKECLLIVGNAPKGITCDR